MDWVLPFLTADNIIKVIAIFGSIISFVVFIHSKLTQLSSDVSQIKEHQKTLMDSLNQINNILTKIAVQDTRLNMLEKDIDELRHGQGFISKQ